MCDVTVHLTLKVHALMKVMTGAQGRRSIKCQKLSVVRGFGVDNLDQ